MSTSEVVRRPAVAAVPLYSRNATGLVKLGTPYRILVANLINIGVTYAAFYFWLAPGIFPETNLILAVLLVIPFGLCFLTAWALMGVLMPRSGAEYTWASRAIHPAIGFGLSGVTFVSWTFWTGLAGYWVGTLVLGPVLSVLGATNNNSTLLGMGTALQTTGFPSWPWALGVAGAIGSLLILSFGMETYYKIQQWMWHIGLVTLALAVGVLLFGSTDQLKEALNSLATAQGFNGDAFNTIVTAAAAKPSGLTLYALLGMFPIFSFAATTSGYIAGEVRTPKRTQLIGTVAGGAVYSLMVLVILLAMAKGVGLDFNNDAAWVSLNDPDHYPVASSPTFLLWMALLAKSNVLVMVLMTIGLVIFSINWAPTVIIAASRQLFVWGFDRLLPEQVTRVSRQGSPTLALIIITVLAVILITAYSAGYFLYIAPFLALIVAFGIVCLIAMLVPFLPTTRRMYEGSPADIRVAGVPLITITGAVGVIFYAIGLYYALTVSSLGFNTTSNLLLTALSFIIPAAAYFVIKAIRARQGIMLDALYKELPPE
jgi:basic amino acid/polyamine antiporter, APA family